MHVLAAQSLFASGLLRRALPDLEGLRHFGHTVAMGVLWRNSVSYLFHASPDIEASRGLGRIGLLPATTSGIGMALLAELDADEVAELYEGQEVPVYQTLEALLAKLGEVRALGYARVHVADARDHHIVALATGDPAHAGIAMSGWIPEAATEPLVQALREVASTLRD